MGCHTWTYIPKINGKENIIKHWKSIGEYFYWEDEHEFIDWGNEDDYLYIKYTSYYFLVQGKAGEWVMYERIEEIGDEPRIGGYPDRVVRSYEDMEDFMSTGFDGEHCGKPYHFDFYYDQERKEQIMEGIKNFFKKHPEGIICFG